MQHGHGQVVLVNCAVTGVIHLNSDGGHTRLRIDDGHTCNVAFRGLAHLVIALAVPLAPVNSVRGRTVHNTRRISTDAETSVNGVAILGYHVRITGWGITTCVNVDGPNPTRVGGHDLIGNTVTVSAIAAVTTREFFEDDVPVGRLG